MEQDLGSRKPFRAVDSKAKHRLLKILNQIENHSHHVLGIGYVPGIVLRAQMCYILTTIYCHQHGNKSQVKGVKGFAQDNQ